jgi:hypothetical protein
MCLLLKFSIRLSLFDGPLRYIFENKWDIPPCSLNENLSTFLKNAPYEFLCWKKRTLGPPECTQINNYPYDSYVILSRMA